MNHEIEDDVDVEAALRKRAEAMDFDEPRIRDEWQRLRHGRVEPLRMSGREQRAAALRRVDEATGIGNAWRNRFFNQRGDAGAEKRQRHVQMRHRRHGNGHCVDVRNQIARLRKDTAAELGGYFIGARPIRIADAHQVDAVHRRKQPRVMLAKMADTDDGDANHLAASPPLASVAGRTRPTTAMSASFAAAMTASPSSISVLPASMDSAVAPATRIA